jgi:hypothetical protein
MEGLIVYKNKEFILFYLNAADVFLTKSQGIVYLIQTRLGVLQLLPLMQ